MDLLFLSDPPRGASADLMRFLLPNWLRRDLSWSFVRVRLLLSVFSKFSVRIVPRVDVFLMCLWGEVNSMLSYSTILIPSLVTLIQHILKVLARAIRKSINQSINQSVNQAWKGRKFVTFCK